MLFLLHEKNNQLLIRIISFLRLKNKHLPVVARGQVITECIRTVLKLILLILDKQPTHFALYKESAPFDKEDLIMPVNQERN